MRPLQTNEILIRKAVDTSQRQFAAEILSIENEGD